MGLLIGMIAIGVFYAWVFHTLSMPLFNSILIHCLILGLGFGILNFLLASLYMRKHAQLKHYNEILRSRVFVDNLTGLYNRRAFDQECKKTNGSEYSILFIDIDNFRVFNNQYGHRTGDEVLQKVGRVIKDTVRSGDRAYRYGGEEIVVFLNDCNSENAHRIAEKIRIQVSRIDNHSYPPITISLGVASSARDGDPIQEILEKSDAALLQAKILGKNRTVCL